MPSKPLLDCAFEGTFDNVSAHLQKLDAELDRNDVAPSCKDDILIVLGEVLNNIVEHGYKERNGGDIHLKAHAEKDAVHISTVDHGPPIPRSTLSEANLPEKTEDMQTMPEGGFGWFMIHALTDDMSYERVDGQNRFSFSILC